ncbi:MAG: PAS domain S-box protein [Methylotenera sp.]|nr:PAS domain S-box protein [Oligoflexia bacterium]
MIRFEDIVDHMPGIMYRFYLRPDGSSGLHYLSPAAEVLCELPREKMLADFSLIALLFHPDDRASFNESVMASARTLSPYEWQGRLLFADGRIKWIQATSKPRLQEAGEIIWDGILIDITERKEIEEGYRRTSLELQEQKAFLRGILANVPYSVFWKDENCVYRGCNEQFAKDAGILSTDSIVGKTDFEMPWKNDGAEFYRKCDFQVMQSGIPLSNYEETQINATGKRTTLMTSKVPLRSSTGEITGVLGIYTDITDFREAQDKIHEQQAKLITASKMSALGEMAAGMAHEINNPLAIIQALVGHAQTLLSGSKDQDRTEVVAMLKNVESTVGRIAKIVNGLQFFSRESSSDPFTNVPLGKVLNETLIFCSERFKNHSIELRIGPIDEDLLLHCRPSQISQVVLNLLNNGFDAVEKLPEKWVKIDVQSESGFVEIQVTDSGKGIPPEVHQKMFQPFYTTKAIGKGTGLGLSVSKGIVESHSGHFIYNLTSANTQFVVRLPLAQASKND